MGMPPPANSNDADAVLAQVLCAEHNRFDVVESSEWTFNFPMLDADIASAFGQTIDIFATPNGNPPAGITTAYNTLTVPGLPNSNMILWGLIIRISVESEGRLIRGNYYVPPGGSTFLPFSPDVYDSQDAAAAFR